MLRCNQCAPATAKAGQVLPDRQDQTRVSSTPNNCRTRCTATNFRVVPQPAVSMRNKLREQKAWNSLNQLISLSNEERRHFETKRLGRLEIDHQLEFGRRLHRKIAGCSPLRMRPT